MLFLLLFWQVRTLVWTHTKLEVDTVSTTATTAPAPGGTPMVHPTPGVPPGAGTVVAVVAMLLPWNFVGVQISVRTCQNNNKNSTTNLKHNRKHNRNGSAFSVYLWLFVVVVVWSWRLQWPMMPPGRQGTTTIKNNHKRELNIAVGMSLKICACLDSTRMCYLSKIC